MEIINKLSILEFDRIKIRLQMLLNKYRYSQKDDIKSDLIKKQYLQLVDVLLTHDLSEIPFNNWDGIEIKTTFDSKELEEKIIDFSKTKANLDFKKIKIYQKGNFRSCNVKNIDKLGKYLDINSFEQTVINDNLNIFLSDNIPKEIKEKYYTSKIEIEDLISLSNSQLEELEKKNIELHFKKHNNYLDNIKKIIKIFGLKKVLQLYKTSTPTYQIVLETSGLSKFDYEEDMTIEEIKKNTINRRRKLIFDSTMPLDITKYSNVFKQENPDIFLASEKLSPKLQEKFYQRELTIEDVKNNINLFYGMPVEYFMIEEKYRLFGINIGPGSLTKILKHHEDIFERMLMNDELYSFKLDYECREEDFEKKLYKVVKSYIRKNRQLDHNYIAKTKTLPAWIVSMDFKIVPEITEISTLENYDYSTIIIDKDEDLILDIFGKDNIIRFDKETGYFSFKEGQSDLSNNFKKLSKFIEQYKNIPIITTYEEFTDYLARCFDKSRSETFDLNYDCIDGEFREKYYNIFIDKGVPHELKEKFYKKKITPSLLMKNKEYIPYLLKYDLSTIIVGNYNADFYNSAMDYYSLMKDNFIDYYAEKYGKENLLSLLAKYGDICEDLSYGSFDILASKEELEKQYRNKIYKKILSTNNGSFIINLNINNSNFKQIPTYKDILSLIDKTEYKKFITEHPDIFIEYDLIPIENEQEKLKIYRKFYEKELTYDDIMKYPKLVQFFKNKNIKHAFGFHKLSKNESTELSLIDSIGNEQFLELCLRYGRYLKGIKENVSKLEKISTLGELFSEIEEIISEECLKGKFLYFPEDAPKFLKIRNPELFLSDDAPKDLKQAFYCDGSYLTFDKLKNNKEWLLYLKDKAVLTALLKQNPRNMSIREYFKLFGQEKALKYGVEKTETINKMLFARQVDIMKKWYDKTGQRFIPDYVVMQNFSLEEVDKFLTSAHNWNNLIKIKNFSSVPEGREAILKLAYSFGAFDHDQTGTKKLFELLTGIPKNISVEDYNNLIDLENSIINYEIDVNNKTITEEKISYIALKTKLINEGILKEQEQSVIKAIYNGTTLKINPQNHKNSIPYLRMLLEDINIVINPFEAHQLFGGFNLKYDPDFREFLLNNLEKIRKNPDAGRHLSSIQKKFNEIKRSNSNRVLTLDLAISFVQTNKYTNINIGNEKVAEVSAIAGYSQSDFEILQQIYNYGKQRIFSSIPRIERKNDKYSYEILRLDDPLALAIGTLTDCCQELNNCAELCMEHSMVDKNGRVFIIKDSDDNVIAQSWIWRNKNVICFDNIEIPKKAFARAQKNNNQNGEVQLTQIVFNLYKQAASDFIKEDEIRYRELLNEGKITKEQYEGLKLRKITVGLGYNDIAEILIKNAKKDNERIVRPPSFDEPVVLSRGLYTNDSETQYILEELPEIGEYIKETLSVYNDNYIEYTDDNFKENDLITLKKLETITKKNPYYLKTELQEYDDSSKIVTTIANNYSLNPKRTRIIMNPNFAIIYSFNEKELIIGDLFYNLRIDNGNQQLNITKVVLIQIKLALEQIKENKTINTSLLTKEQQELLSKSEKIDLDTERGVGYAK